MLKKTLLASFVLPVIGIMLKLINHKLAPVLFMAGYFLYIWASVLILAWFNLFLFRKIQNKTYIFLYGAAASIVMLFVIHVLLYYNGPHFSHYILNRILVEPSGMVYLTVFRGLLLQCICFGWMYFMIYRIEHQKAGQEINRLVSHLHTIANKEETSYKNTLVVSFQDKIFPVETTQLAFILLSSGIVYAYLNNGQRYVVNTSLEAVAEALDPAFFFRANRQCIVRRNAIQSVEQIEGRKLKVRLFAAPQELLIVSKAKATAFITWLKS